MAVTEWRNPTIEDYLNKGDNNIWEDAWEVFTSDNTRGYSSIGPSEVSDWLFVRGFYFTSVDVPEGSIINGVEVKIERQSSDETRIFDDAVYLVYGDPIGAGGTIGENAVVTPAGWKTDEDEIVIFGSSIDLWGYAITCDTVYDIGVGISAANVDAVGGSDDARIDCIWIRIHFTPPADPDSGWKLPGTAVNADRDGSVAWSNPGYVLASDDNRAIVDVAGAGYSDWLRCTNFGFTYADIPAGSTIDGIKVRIERQSENDVNISDNAIYLRKASGRVGDNKASATGWIREDIGGTPIDEAPFYGGATELWNAGLTLDDILSSSFGIDISAGNSGGKAREARVDSVQIGIYYTEPVPEIRTKDFAADAFLQKSITKSFDINTFLQKTDTKDFDIDVFLRQVFTKDFDVDSFIRKVQSKDFSIDAFLQGALPYTPGFRRTSCEKHYRKTHEYTTNIDEAREHRHTEIYDPDKNLLVRSNEQAEEDELINQPPGHEEETHIKDI